MPGAPAGTAIFSILVRKAKLAAAVPPGFAERTDQCGVQAGSCKPVNLE